MASAKKVGAAKGSGGLQRIDVPAGSYRHVVLWFTTPPTASEP